MISPDARYCKIVQADDYIYPGCLQAMVETAQRHPSAGVVAARRMIHDIVDPPLSDVLQPLTNGKEICRRVLRGEIHPFGSQTTVMYRADLVRDAHAQFFDERMFFDDVDAVLSVLRTTDFAFCDEVLTYTQRDQASTYGRIMQYFPTLLNQYTMIRRWGSEFFDTDELKALLDLVASQYYQALMREARRADRTELLKFHRTVLGGAGFRWEIARAARAFAALTCGWIAKHLRSRQRQPT
jgi:hypothetical protein